MSNDDASVSPSTTTESGASAPTVRICAFLIERAAWFDYEARHGGDWEHLKRREEECRWIEQAIRSGRYKEDGRPSWLVNAIPVGGAKQPSTTDPDDATGERSSTGGID